MEIMGRFCWCICILVWVQACIIPPCSGCLEEEQNALFLLIKTSVNYPNESLPTDCCDWDGVYCSNITGRVTHIYLSVLLDSWSSRGSEYWYLNTSLFLPFQELESLVLGDYSYNFRVSKGTESLSGLSNLEELNLDSIPFNDSLLPSLAKIATLKILSLRGMKEWDNYEAAYNNSQGFERLSGLSKLEELYLDNNDFNESILPSLGKIASLKILSLSYNKISGRVPINKGFKMSKLEELYLDGNNITDMRFICKIPSLKKLYLRYGYLNGGINIQELGKLKNLQELYLDNSSIDKNFLHKVGVLTSLNVLSMSTSGLNGSLPNQGWCELKNLQELDLGHNHLEGRLPSCLANMTRLRVLNLAFNNFNGSISHSPIPSLQSLEYRNFIKYVIIL